MNGSGFSVSDLLPSFSLVFGAGSGQSAEALSAWFVAILLAIFLGFAIYSTEKFFKAKKHVSFYTNLLAGATQETLTEQRRDLLNRCKEDVEHYHLWREFNESLVEFQVADQRRLGNTLDAAFFFNTSTLSRSLTENRLIAAVPGFLTAIGVIGTFAGLQMGLASLDLGSDTSVGTIREGIGAVIAGASMAFLTSVWGVFLSVLFNFGEKLLERRIRFSITQLQIRIDELFPRYTAESALAQILASNKESQLALQGLAEKIGDKMQEALVETSNTISKGLEDALNRIMAPAIDSLVDNANKGSEEALGVLMERFMDGMGNMGEKQRAALDAASDNVKSSVDAMGSQMNGFIRQLEQQAEQAATRETESTSRMQQQFDQILQSASGSIDKVVASTQEKITEMRALDDERQARFQQSFDQAVERDNALSERIAQIGQTQHEASKRLTTQLQGLASSFAELIVGNKHATEAILKSSSEMNASSNQLGLLSANVKEASTVLSGEISKSVESTRELSETNEQVGVLLAQTMEGVERIQGQTQSLVDGLSQSSELINDSVMGMEQHLKSVMQTMGLQLGDLQGAMKQYVEELNQQVSTLLNDYSGQVNAQTQERLNEWNKQTMEYTGSMKSAISAIGSVVDEIESKVRASA